MERKTDKEILEITNKRNNTLILRYNNKFYNIDKLLKWIKEQGVKNTSQLEYVKDKIKNTWKTKTRHELDIINNKRKQTMFKKFGVMHITHDKEIARLIGEKSRITKEKLGYYLPKDKISLFKLYKNKVYTYTKINAIKKFGLLLKKCGKCGIPGALQIDHIFSIKQGFINNVDPRIVAHGCNLQLIPWEENDKKKDKCYISLKKLKDEIKLSE